MFPNPDVMPSTPTSEVTFIGGFDKVDPPFCEENWTLVGTVKAERHMGDLKMEKPEWWYSSEFTHQIDPQAEGFWMWGDVLVRVIPATILESGLYCFKRKEATGA